MITGSNRLATIGYRYHAHFVAGFILTDEIKAKMATGYYATGQVAPLVDANWYRPAGNYYSTTSEYDFFIYSLLPNTINNFNTLILTQFSKINNIRRQICIKPIICVLIKIHLAALK